MEQLYARRPPVAAVAGPEVIRSGVQNPRSGPAVGIRRAGGSMLDSTGPRLRPIVIRGARTHNLKGVDLTIAPRRLTVVTGVSGSGKSSLAFDTIYAEGQRRYVESLS